MATRSLPVAPAPIATVLPQLTQPRLVPSDRVVIERSPLVDQNPNRSRMPIEVMPALPEQPILDPAPDHGTASTKASPVPVPDANTNEEEDDTDQFFQDMQDPFGDDEVHVRRYQPVRPSSYHTHSRTNEQHPGSARRPSKGRQLSTSNHRSHRRSSNIR